MHLPNTIARAIAPLLTALPPDQAMGRLVPAEGASPELLAVAQSVLRDPAVAGDPTLAAGLWLYVDELDRSHRISQGIATQTGSFWHGIMHRREGDFGNSHYWFNRVGDHPAMRNIPDYDSHAFIDEAARRGDGDPADLVAMQRAEWVALFEWCAGQTA